MSVKVFCDICDKEIEGYSINPVEGRQSIRKDMTRSYKDTDSDENIIGIDSSFNFELFDPTSNGRRTFDICEDCWIDFEMDVESEIQDSMREIEYLFEGLLGTEMIIANS